MSAASSEVLVAPTDVPSTPLERAFFARPTEVVARDLLGVWLLRTTPDGLCGGRIVETEAYGGPEDRASHARAGPTRRTAPMFGPVGHAYVYLVYGMHHCLNVVAYHGREAGAVLIRALEPLIGVDQIRARRGQPTDPYSRLCAGPARLCQGLAVDRALDGHDLTAGDTLWLAAQLPVGDDHQVAMGTRVGVDYAGDWAKRQWRFWLAGNPAVSRRP
jgi:DNA-3-methyladenine glycosylase